MLEVVLWVKLFLYFIGLLLIINGYLCVIKMLDGVMFYFLFIVVLVFGKEVGKVGLEINNNNIKIRVV